MDTSQHAKQLTPGKAEDAYNLLTSYRFAQRYVDGMHVADVCWRALGYGTRLLAESAEYVVGLSGFPQDIKLASTVYAAPNTEYRRAHLPDLPGSSGQFDVVTAFGILEKLEYPEDLIKEAKRILRDGGTFVISTPDKQVHSNDRNYRDPANRREMYVPEFRELLERHFGNVRLYRQGAMAGGLIIEDTRNLSETPVESTRFSSTVPSFDTEPPMTHFVIAVCSNSETSMEEVRQPYLLLDHDRRIFNEYEDYREDAVLLCEEIQRMQETEVQAFRTTLRLRQSEIVNLEARLKRTEARLKRAETQKRELGQRIRAIESSTPWRIISLYRRLRSSIGPLLRKPGP